MLGAWVARTHADIHMTVQRISFIRPVSSNLIQVTPDIRLQDCSIIQNIALENVRVIVTFQTMTPHEIIHGYPLV